MMPVLIPTAFVSLGSAILVVTRKNPIYSAAWLLVCFLSVAVVFLALNAPFLAAIHVLVYTGAILVLFLFVIMLLNLRPDELGEEYPGPARGAVAVMCLTLFGLIASAVLRDPTLRVAVPAPTEDAGSVQTVGMLLFQNYALPFEIVSLLIIVAMFGAMVLAKKKLPE